MSQCPAMHRDTVLFPSIAEELSPNSAGICTQVATSAGSGGEVTGAQGGHRAIAMGLGGGGVCHRRRMTRARVTPACCAWHLRLLSADDQRCALGIALAVGNEQRNNC